MEIKNCFIYQLKYLSLALFFVSFPISSDFFSPSQQGKITQSINKKILIPQKRRKSPLLKIEVKETFRTFLDKTLSTIPLITDIENEHPQKIHHTPSFTLDFAEKLGAIKKSIKYNKGFKHEVNLDQATFFFDQCSRKIETFDSIRSLCLSNLLLLNAKRRIPTDLSQYDLKIIILSQNILDLKF